MTEFTEDDIVAMANAAAVLATEMQTSGHDIYPEDILDCLATGGLSLVASDGHIAAVTYMCVNMIKGDTV